MKKSFGIVLLFVFIFSCIGCSINRETRFREHTESTNLPDFRDPETITGLCSYYGKEFQGKKTASGEIYDMNDLTAAHPSLPFQTRLEVTNLENGKKVIVRINDRGPFVRGRVLDVSYSAAQKLGFINKGVAKIEAKILKNEQKSN